MGYEMTPADVKLIGDFAGALNSGRAQLAPAERFGNIQIPADPAALSIKWSHADELNALWLRAGGTNPTPPASATLIEVPGFGGANWRYQIDQFDAEVYAFRFEVPAGPPLAMLGYSSVFEYAGHTALRNAVLSTLPGDFDTIIGWLSQGVQATQNWTRGDVLQHDPHIVLPAGVYYFNVKNANPGDGNRPAMVEFKWPR